MHLVEDFDSALGVAVALEVLWLERWFEAVDLSPLWMGECGIFALFAIFAIWRAISLCGSYLTSHGNQSTLTSLALT